MRDIELTDEQMHATKEALKTLCAMDCLSIAMWALANMRAKVGQSERPIDQIASKLSSRFLDDLSFQANLLRKGDGE